MKRGIRSLVEKLGHIPVGGWAVLLTLPALVPLLKPGLFESHDGLFHAYRLAALDRAVRAGVFYPRWFPEFAFGYGHPVLNFYGPLSYYWGLPVTLLGGSAVLALKLVFALGLISSALAMYLFARLHLGRPGALVAAVTYAYLPYHLVDLYVRGAFAEYLAFVWFPLVLWAFQRLVEVVATAEDPKHPPLVLITLASLLLGALVVTHSLSALIFTPVLLCYVAILLLRARSQRAVTAVALALILCAGLSAFYWLPVLAESRYVGLGYGASQGYRDHLVPLSGLVSLDPTYPYPGDPSITPTFPLGLAQVAILAAGMVLIASLWRRRWVSAFFLIVAVVSVYMLTGLSLPVWRMLEPGLALLQYPWRFQALTVLATAFLAGALGDVLCRKARGGAGTLLVAGCLLLLGSWAMWNLPVTPTGPDLSVEAMWQLDRDHGQVGATWTGEYLPVWVAEQRWALARPVAEATPGESALPAGQVRLAGVAHTRFDLSVEAPQGTTLVLHQFHYPGWQARWQDEPIPSQPAGVLALAGFQLPAGKGPLIARLSHTPAQLAGTWLSLLLSLLVSIALVTQQRRERSRPVAGALPVAACCLLLACILLASLCLPNGYVHATKPVNANLEGIVELLAYTTDARQYLPGEPMAVTLYWRALRDPGTDYKAFVHLTDANRSHQPAQHDGDPNGGFTPTSRWLQGEVVADTHRLVLPANLPAGRYQLWAGMYEFDEVRNLTVLSAETPVADDRVLLGEIEVTAP